MHSRSPPGQPWQDRSLSWVRRMHGILRQVLMHFGVATEVCSQEQKFGDTLCFHHQTPDDLMLRGHKIVGSAQRKLRGALMQHGSILFAQSPHAPSLPGIAELAGTTIAPVNLTAALEDEFRRATGWRLERSEWSAAEHTKIAEIARVKYAASSWNDKREVPEFPRA